MFSVFHLRRAIIKALVMNTDKRQESGLSKTIRAIFFKLHLMGGGK